MLLRLAYLGITNTFALLRLLHGGDRDKDIEILSLRHQLAVLQRQLNGQQVRFEPVDRAWLAALLHPLPRPTLRRLRLLVQPDTILKWHRNLIARRHAAASWPRRRGRPRTLRSIRALVLRLARENGSWGYRRVHGELLTLGITLAPSTVWEILHEAGIDPAPDRAAITWTDFLHSQAQALLAADFIETVTLTGARMYILAVIEHASRRIRVLGVTAHPTAGWVGQAARNLVMDLEGRCCVIGSDDVFGRRPGSGSDRQSQLGERRGNAQLRWDVHAEFVMSAAEVLNEGVPGDDHLGCSIGEQPAHWP